MFNWETCINRLSELYPQCVIERRRYHAELGPIGIGDPGQFHRYLSETVVLEGVFKSLIIAVTPILDRDAEALNAHMPRVKGLGVLSQ